MNVGGFEESLQQGRDVEADILVTLQEVLHGATRQISLRKGPSEKIQTYTIKIPQGVHEGQRIRLAGQGSSSRVSGVPGDLYLRVKLQQHPDFSFEGSSIFYELELPVWQAVLGGELMIPTPDGRVFSAIYPVFSIGQEVHDNPLCFFLSRRLLPSRV